MAAEFTVKAECTPGGMYVDWTAMPPVKVAKHLLDNNKRLDILRLDVLVQRNDVRYFGPVNCVTVVKSVLNLDAPWCHSPAQLRRRLLSMGALSLMRE